MILARSTFSSRISGADETLVRYALRLNRAGLLHSVTLLHQPPPDAPYLQRLQEAGIVVDAVATSLLPDLLLSVRRLAILLRLIPDSTMVAARLMPGARQSLPRRSWQRIWQHLSLLHLGQCRRHFGRAGASLVHIIGSDSGAAILIRAARGAGLPVLMHELGTIHHLPEVGAHYRRFAAAIPRCTELAALSPTLAQEWRDFYNHDRPVRVVPLLYDDAGPRPGPPQDRHTVTFGFAARLEHGKGLMFLLDAFHQLHRRRPATRLVISGVGPLLETGRSRAADLGLSEVCRFLGYTLERDKLAMLSDFDVFVLPTLAEGTPNSLIEAMMLGVPVVASGVGGIPDMFGPEAALLVPPADVDALADALMRLADDAALRTALGAAGRKRYEQLFHPDAVLSVLLHEYHRTTMRADDTVPADTAPLLTHPWVRDHPLVKSHSTGDEVEAR